VNTRLLILSFICLLLSGIQAFSSELNDCLNLANYHQHRLEKEAGVRFCFNKHKNTLTKEACNQTVDKKVAPMDSIRLTEDMRGLCFYDTPPTPTLKGCLQDTKRFKSASNHDEAVFFCYQQFQEKLTTAECLKTAKQLIFPVKKEYLEQHCYENAGNE
jgi:hypothetical protein